MTRDFVKRDVLWRVAGALPWIAAAPLAFSQAAPVAAAPPAATPKEFDPTTVLSLLPTVLPNDVDLGPLKLTFGPQENGNFGAILSGGGSKSIDSLKSHSDGVFPTTNFWRYYGAVEYNVDASWASGSDSLNQSTLSVKPQITFVSMTPAVTQKVLVDPSKQELCDDLAQQFEAGDSGVLESYVENCPLKDKAPGERFAITLIGDALYRYGEFDIGGTPYEANQLLVGGGLRAFLPQATKSPIFREWPRLTVLYYKVSDSAQSTLPDPDAYELNTIAADTKIRLRVPMPGQHTGTSPFHLDIDLRASKATQGDDRDWKFFREFQLAIDIGKDQWKPAITYRSGQDKGLQYDKQIILGVLMDLLK